MQIIQFSSRDNGRTPFQWNSSVNAGFTTGTPWIKVNKNYTTINAAAEEKDPNSCLNYFRAMVAMRKRYPALVYGQYKLLDKRNTNVYAYTREYEGQKFLIVLNFSAISTKTTLGIDISNNKLLLNNYKTPPSNYIKGSVVNLRPYEALVFKL